MTRLEGRLLQIVRNSHKDSEGYRTLNRKDYEWLLSQAEEAEELRKKVRRLKKEIETDEVALAFLRGERRSFQEEIIKCR